MNAALWFLIRLQLAGWARRLVRNLATVKGILLALVGGLVISTWILSLLISPRSANVPAESVMLYGPTMVLAYCLLNVVLTSGDRSVYFTPAEVNFLFTGPFTRRQILLYKITSMLLIGSPTPLLMTLFLRVYGRSFLAVFVAMVLIYVFMTLFTMALNLIVVASGAKMYNRTRKVVFVLIVIGVCVLVLQQGGLPQTDWGAWAKRTLETKWWQTITVPLQSFFHVFLADSFGWEFVKNILYACALNLALLGIVLLLDADYLESASTASARIYEKLQQLRTGNLTGGKASFGLPSFPYWGGAGPIFWRQSLTALRGLGRILFVGLLLTVMASSFFMGSLRGEAGAALPAIGGMLLWITIFITVLVPFDFRGDIDRMAMLKTFPISPWVLSLGQILAPTFLLTCVHVVILTGFYLVPLFQGSGEPIEGRLLVIFALFSFPFNFYLFGLENLLFLFFPVRILANSPGDFQSLGRNVILMMGKMVGLMFVFGVAGFVGMLAYFVHGRNTTFGLSAAWFVVAFSGVALLPLIGYAFRQFDVGRDTPA